MIMAVVCFIPNFERRAKEVDRLSKVDSGSTVRQLRLYYLVVNRGIARSSEWMDGRYSGLDVGKPMRWTSRRKMKKEERSN